MIEGGAFTVKLSVFEPLPNGLVAVTVKLATPVADGVPLTTPVDGFTASPAGRTPPVTDHVIEVVLVALRLRE